MKYPGPTGEALLLQEVFLGEWTLGKGGETQHNISSASRLPPGQKVEPRPVIL